jgi:hypothetical protein
MYTVDNLTERVGQLSVEEQRQLFQLVTEHAELLNKVLPDMPLLAHILNNTTSDHELVQSYVQWKNNS